MKKALLLISIIGIVVVSGSASYYLLVILPHMNQQQLEQTAKQDEAENRLKQQSLKNDCLKIKYGNSGSAGDSMFSTYMKESEKSNLDCNKM